MNKYYQTINSLDDIDEMAEHLAMNAGIDFDEAYDIITDPYVDETGGAHSIVGKSRCEVFDRAWKDAMNEPNTKEDLNQAWAVFEQLIKSDYGSYGLVYGLQDGILWYTITKNVFGEVAVLNDENSVSSVSLAQCIYMACEKWLNS